MAYPALARSRHHSNGKTRMVQPRLAPYRAPTRSVWDDPEQIEHIIVALPGRVDLELWSGDDFWLAVTLADAAGNPLDLTGATVAAQVRPQPIPPGTIPTDPPAGAFQVQTMTGNAVLLRLTNQVSAQLPATGVWDLQLTRPDGTIITLLAGTVTMTGQVTFP